MPLRECDLNAMDNCTIARTRKRTGGTISSDRSKSSFETSIDFIIGGPNPCACLNNLEALIDAFEPEEGSGDVAIPKIGEMTVVSGKFYFCVERSIQQQKPRSSESTRCRKWVVTNKWETYNSEARRPAVPQTQDGTPITDPNDLDNSQATVKLRSGTEQQIVEFAQYLGVYDYAGAPKTCDFIDNRYVCQPLKRAEIGETIPVMNSAGVRFDPPLQMDAGHEKIVITKPFRYVNGNKLSRLKNCINCDPFFIVEMRNGEAVYGRYVEPFTARVADITLADNFLPNGSVYREVSVELVFRDNIIETLDEFGDLVSSENFGWDDLVPNQGLSHLIYPGGDDYNGGEWPYEPVIALGPAGQAPITVGGQAVTEPQWLDCNGLPFINNEVLDPEAADPINCSVGVNPKNILYIRYRKYKKAIKFTSTFNFPNFLGTVFYHADNTITGVGQLPIANFPLWASAGSLGGTVLEPPLGFVSCAE